MSTLIELVRRPVVAKQELMDVLEALTFNGRDLGLVEAREVVSVLDRCDPPLKRQDLELLRGYCRRASTDLRNSSRTLAAQDWGKILDAIESRLGQMPR